MKIDEIRKNDRTRCIEIFETVAKISKGRNRAGVKFS